MRRLACAALLLLLVGCSGGGSAATHYQLGEFFITGPAALSGETRSITVENAGEFPHTLVVTTPEGDVVVASGLLSPSETVSMELALDPGTYLFTCRIVGQGADGQLVDHYERGMHTTVSFGG